MLIGLVFTLVGVLLLGSLGLAAGVAALRAAREDLRALASRHAALEARVARLAPSAVDALDAAVTARLLALDAADGDEALRRLAELRAPPPDASDDSGGRAATAPPPGLSRRLAEAREIIAQARQVAPVRTAGDDPIGGPG